MKPLKLILAAVLSIIVAGTVLTSCRKARLSEAELNTASAEATDNALSEGVINDIQNIADQASAFAGGMSFRMADPGSIMSQCATVTIDTLVNPHTMVIDFGTTNCLCRDNRYRRGQMLINFNGRYRDPGTVINVSFNNYFVDDNQVTGTKTITNNGLNAANHMNWSIVANMSIIKANNAGTLSYTCNRNREWIAGDTSKHVFMDDVFSITGTASGTKASGTSFTAVIQSPLIRKMACPRHFVTGVLEVTPQGKPTRSIDFGTGTCDNQATLTVNGQSKVITLR